MNKLRIILFFVAGLLLISCGCTRLPEQQYNVGWADLLDSSNKTASELNETGHKFPAAGKGFYRLQFRRGFHIAVKHANNVECC